MLAIWFVLVLALLALCSFAPGFLIVRTLRWSAIEKLCGAVAVSLSLLWLLSWAIYLLPIPWTPAAVAVSVGCMAAWVVCWRDIRRLFRSPLVRRTVICYGVLLGWTLIVLSVIRTYSGSDWSGDWAEHFQRSLIFLHRLSPHTEITGAYALPARPPLMNVLAALFLAQSADRFELFQLIFAFLNLLVFLPCCMAVPRLIAPRRPKFAVLLGIFATSPVIMQNATYTWTKALTAFFVITALCFYVAGWRRGSTTKIVMAFVAVSMGLLVHYSAAPYLLFFALHYVFFVRRVRVAAYAALSCGLLLLPWFGWSIANFGTHGTVASNTSITTAQGYAGNNFVKITGNLVDTIVPRLLYRPETFQSFTQVSPAGMVRDIAFLTYEKNLVFSMGLIGGPIVLITLLPLVRRQRFWILFLGWTILAGIAAVGERAPMGTGHLTLLPIEVLGLAYLSTRFSTRRLVAWLIIAGCAIDFSIGIYLHTRIQHQENTPERTMFGGLLFLNGKFTAGLAFDSSLLPAAWANWFAKHQSKLVDQWGREMQSFHRGDPVIDAARSEGRQWLASIKAKDHSMWGGWYARHDGEMTFIGDHFGDSDATSYLLLLGAVGLLGAMAKVTQWSVTHEKSHHGPGRAGQRRGARAGRNDRHRIRS